jgi:hypothetical protein
VNGGASGQPMLQAAAKMWQRLLDQATTSPSTDDRQDSRGGRGMLSDYDADALFAIYFLRAWDFLFSFLDGAEGGPPHGRRNFNACTGQTEGGDHVHRRLRTRGIGGFDPGRRSALSFREGYNVD